MNDPMQEMVCPRCGSDEVRLVDRNVWFERTPGSERVWKDEFWWCEGCLNDTEPESRAEYLAANDDDPRGDPVVEGGGHEG